MNVKTKLYIFTIIFLLFLGNLMIYSSSMIWAEYITNNPAGLIAYNDWIL